MDNTRAEEMKNALIRLREIIELDNILEIHMPRICVGFHNLRWNFVKSMMSMIMSGLSVKFVLWQKKYQIQGQC